MRYEILSGRHPDGTYRCIGVTDSLDWAIEHARKHHARIYDIARSCWVSY